MSSPRHHWLCGSLTLALVAAALGACAPAKEEIEGLQAAAVNTQRAPYKPVVGKPGGTISYATFGEPKTFNYGVAAESSSTEILDRCFKGLVDIDGSTGAFIPCLAESWVIQPDQRTVVFTLRPDLKWSDGQPLTVDDVVFSFNEIAMNYPAIPSNLHDSLMIDGKYITVTKIDDRHVQVQAPKPFGPIITAAGSVPVMPKHICQQAIHQKDSSGKIAFNAMWGVDSDVTKIVTNGPFKIGEYVPGERTVLVRNPYYYGKDAAGQQLPYIDRYVFYSLKDYAAVLLKFKAGEIDIDEPMRPADYEVMKPLEKYGNFTIDEGGVAARSDYLIFNMTTAKDAKSGKPFEDPIKVSWFRDLHFRKALQYSVDRPTMIRSIYRGLASPCYSATVLNGCQYYTTDVEHYDYNMEKAAEELKAGGYTRGADGQLRDPAGHPVAFTLTTNAGNTNRDAQCNILRTDWNKLGMKVDYKPIEFNVMVGKIDETHDFDCILMGLNLEGANDPHLGMNSWLLDGKMHMFNKGDGTSHMPWEQEILDLYNKGAAATDDKVRQQIYKESMRLEAKYLPYIYTVSQNHLCGVRNTIHNSYPTALGRSWWNIQHQYVRSES